jgi:transposase
MLSHASLPDDIDALKAMIVERDEIMLDLREQLSSHAVEIEHLKLLIAKLKRMQFGRKSEKLDREIEQLELKLEALETDAADSAADDISTAKQQRNRAPRKPLPDHLPRDEKVYLPTEEACPICGGNLRQLGEDVAEQLEYVPANFRVIRHIRPKMACTCCDCILQAPAPRSLRGRRIMSSAHC